MLGILADIDASKPLADQVNALAELYKIRTGRCADVVCLHPNTLAKNPLSGKTSLPFRTLVYVQTYNIWVGESDA